MVKTRSKRHVSSSESLADEVSKATQNPGTPGRDERVWVRDDGAVCFGDECLVIKADDKTGVLDFTVSPDACGPAAGPVILEHLIKTAGKGVHIIVPASEVNSKKRT